jgi:GNAT superfamily N-acetyltransferase
MEREISICRETSKEKLLSFLEKDRIWAGYAICDLEPELFPLCDWYTARMNNDVISLALYFKGLEPQTQITMGAPTGIDRILETAEVPGRLYAHIPLRHRQVLEKFYSFTQLKSMKRMMVTRKSFRPAVGSTKRLEERDLQGLEELYAPPHEAFFRRYMLTSGVYYGVQENGTLVSAAGTHVCSPSHRLACVGNVFTHPSHRGKSYGTICTSEAVKELLTIHDDVILNVDSRNLTAIKIYEKLGFQEYCMYLEGLCLKI